MSALLVLLFSKAQREEGDSLGLLSQHANPVFTCPSQPGEDVPEVSLLFNRLHAWLFGLDKNHGVCLCLF